MSIDLTTDIGRVRLLVPDRDETNGLVYTDEEIGVFLAIEGGVRRAAALALETIASDTAATLRVTRSLALDVSVDGAKTSDALLKRAAVLREQADIAEAASGGLFDIAEWAVDEFSAREILANDLLRSGL